MASKPGVSKNVLPRQKLRAIEDWVLKNWATFIASKMTLTEAAAMATRHFEYIVTESNIRNAAKVVGKEWPRVNGAHGIAGFASKQKAVLVAVCGVIRQIAGELQVELPPEIVEYADQQSGG